MHNQIGSSSSNIFTGLGITEILSKSTELCILYFQADFNPITIADFDNMIAIKEMLQKEYEYVYYLGKKQIHKKLVHSKKHIIMLLKKILCNHIHIIIIYHFILK